MLCSTPIAKDPDPNNVVKMQQKLLYCILLPFVIYPSGSDLLKMSCFSQIPMIASVVYLCVQDLLKGNILSSIIYIDSQFKLSCGRWNL